ncbi:MAG TPA: CRISPR-associated endonuclease Cas3'', partial [Streptomyces sp.]|nr:CRISPR-associated endonuclease Cas3'' [Streptomyces sp.]
MNQENWLEQALLSWGKTDVRGASQAVGGPAWNSLLAHLLDTAAVAGCLWDRYLPPTVISRLADAFGRGQPLLARRMMMFLAALHDLGKASDCFLRMFGAGRHASPQMRAERELWEEAARAGGLPLATDLQAAPWARHEHITAAHLPRLLGCDCRDCGGQGDVHEGLHAVAHLLGGHHGNIPQKDTVDRAAGAASLATWEPIYRA